MSASLIFGAPPDDIVVGPPLPADGLQAVVDALPAGGGTVEIVSGDYYADPADPSATLTLPEGVTIRGAGLLASAIKSPVVFNGDYCGLEDLALTTGIGANSLVAAGVVAPRLRRVRLQRDAGAVAFIANITSCTAVTIDECVWSTTGAATAALNLNTDIGRLANNLFNGWGAVSVATVTGQDIQIGPNSFDGGGFITDTSE